MENLINKIHCADCLEIMKQIPDKSIDLILTDPPYGDNIGYGRNKKTILNNEDETINYKVIPIYYNKLKQDSNLYIFTNRKFVESIREFIEVETKFTIRMMLILVKNNIGMGYGFRNQYELCLVCEKGSPKYNLNDFSNVMFMEHIEHTDNTHPHQKGLEILKKIISHSTKKGDIILDTFIGSGSTAVAAKQLERNFIGVELEQKYVDIANKRLANTTISLF